MAATTSVSLAWRGDLNIGLIGLVGRRLVTALPQLFLVAAMVFVLLRLLPADPLAMAVPPNATTAEVEAVRHLMGLDLPIYQQFAIWLGQLSHGDLGQSIVFRQPVVSLIETALPATIELTIMASIFSSAFGLVGAFAMFRMRGPVAEPALDFLTTLAMSIPEFLWAIFFILLFGVSLNLLPFAGRLPPDVRVPGQTGFLLIDCLLSGNIQAFAQALEYMLLPALSLALGSAALITRVLRSSLLDVYVENYILMARLRGLSESAILLRHAFKNAFLPTLNLMGVQLSFLFGGTLLVEVIFSYPGIGNLMVEAVRNTDLPIIQAAALIYSLAVLAITLAVDLLMLMLNPKLRTPA
jgi:ABC-type dipeptide/oligopeptide/nickel transport system permease component